MNDLNKTITAGKLFADMCREVISEASTTGDIVKSHPGGSAIMKNLHTTTDAPHDLKYQKIEKISWSELKDYSRKSWVIIIGSQGTGAIKVDDNTYNARAAKADGEVKSFRNERGGNILDFLKGEIGKLTQFYVALKQTDTRRKKQERDNLKKSSSAGSGAVSQETLLRKFKPLWARAIQAAIADSKGHVVNMIKNDAFEKAKKKMSQIESLQNGLDSIESGDTDPPGFIRSAVNNAVLMTASYYYPEQTGTISRERYGGGQSQAQFSEGPRQLLKDIESGDTAKVGTVLAFFKRALISG